MYSTHYFTPKLEIKPQLPVFAYSIIIYYFTPKLEIKPQLAYVLWCLLTIILHQN